VTDGGRRGDLKYRSAARHRAARLAAFCRRRTSSAHVASALAPNFRTNTSGGRHGGFVPEADISIRGAGAAARDMCKNFGKKK
jgi:hypothetical protein